MAYTYNDNLSEAGALTKTTNNINSFIIDVSDMPQEETNRKFTITGDKGAEFKIIALQNPSSSSSHTLYYNWVDKSFAAGHNKINNDLIITLGQRRYVNSILFPSGAGEFVIKLIPLNKTTIKKLTNQIISKDISKISTNSTVTFTPGTLTTTAANYATLPTSTSTGAVNSTDNVSFAWAVTNSTTAAKSHGFRLLRTNDDLLITDGSWYFQTTDTVNGAVSSSTTVVVDDITDIVVGMSSNEVSSGSLSGTPLISAIDTVTKTLTLSSEQTFADGITLYFRAYGSNYIREATGLEIAIDNTTFEGEILTSTVRADSDGDYTTSTTVTLGATLGISGGNVVSYTGEGVDNSSANTVTSVTPDPSGGDGDGAMVVTLTQILRKGAILRFSGCHKIVNFEGIIKINKYPSANRTIYLDLEKIITLGTAS